MIRMLVRRRLSHGHCCRQVRRRQLPQRPSSEPMSQPAAAKRAFGGDGSVCRVGCSHCAKFTGNVCYCHHCHAPPAAAATPEAAALRRTERRKEWGGLGLGLVCMLIAIFYVHVSLTVEMGAVASWCIVRTHAIPHLDFQGRFRRDCLVIADAHPRRREGVRPQLDRHRLRLLVPLHHGGRRRDRRRAHLHVLRHNLGLRSHRHAAAYIFLQVGTHAISVCTQSTRPQPSFTGISM